MACALWLSSSVGVHAQSAAPDTGAPADTGASGTLLELHFTPTGFAQLAVWIEDGAGKFLATLGLTDAVATRGIGNRPGASQMNSGFRWPYGRREGVLPIWAHRRAAADGAKQFRRVVFQDRVEGKASQTANDSSPDSYFCLSFDTSKSQQDALDAVSCASIFNSDKGRFITAADVANGYAEPYEDIVTHVGIRQPLTLDSLYPPRRDIKSCAPVCADSVDLAVFDQHAREVMPEIDTVTMATLKAGEPKQILYSVPSSWSAGDYRACVEINVEGDYNQNYDATHFPTPHTPSDDWDTWATGYGYAYRGQPSLVYCVPFMLGPTNEMEFSTAEAEGSVASWDTAAAKYGALSGMETMTDDPQHAPGSGADRLMMGTDGSRLRVVVRSPKQCDGDSAPTAVTKLAVSPYHDKLHSHEWASLEFGAAGDDTAVFRYDVRVSTDPITNEASFMRGEPAKSASLAADELRVPTAVSAGKPIAVSFGGLVADTHYYVGVRAIDGCAQDSPLRITDFTTTRRIFATVTPCFVATAAYGTPFADEISALRRFRDRHMATNAFGRAFIDAYWQVGPKLAAAIRDSQESRSIARVLLTPVVYLARLFQG